MYQQLVIRIDLKQSRCQQQKLGSHAFKPFDSYRAPGALSTWLALELAWLGLCFGLPTAGRMVATGTQ